MRTKFLLFFMLSGSLVLFGQCSRPDSDSDSDADSDEETGIAKEYTVKVNNEPLLVYPARVSALPINGCFTRPLEQTEIASFASFDADGTVNVEIETNVKIKKLTIRPLSKNITPQVDGKKIRFQVKEPCQLTVEINDHHEALHLFANPIEERKKNREDYTYYFGPGLHQAGIIELKDNESVYVEEGAVVETLIKANGVKNISIEGRGIIDASSFVRDIGQNMVIRINECADVYIEGVILRDSPEWTVTMFETKNVLIENVKLVGMWRNSSDGIDICNSTNVTVNNSFVRTFDDCIVLKGKNTRKESNVSDVYVNNCVLWADWGNGLQIGAETVADSIHHCIFRNCDIVHFHLGALGVHACDRAWIYDIHYENIHVEEPFVDSYMDNCQNQCRDISKVDRYFGIQKMSKDGLGRLLILALEENGEYSTEKGRGKIFNIRYKNIQYHADYFTKSHFLGISRDHDVSDVVLENIYIKGKKVTSANEIIYSNEYVSGISVL